MQSKCLADQTLATQTNTEVAACSVSLVDHHRRLVVTVARSTLDLAKASTIKLAVTLETHQRIKDLGSAAAPRSHHPAINHNQRTIHLPVVPRPTKLRVILGHPLKAKVLSLAPRQLHHRQILQ